ncbi:hypothetical protein SNE40_008963 [Patella caerulea]|uniref:Cysteine sulfinic acid decarboxylase n=1 Tax=Patella caerulea TaxID=87958 RepID=A0AAN8PX36_PATCE
MSSANNTADVINGTSQASSKVPRQTVDEQFLRDIFEIMVKDALKDGSDPHSKVIEWKHPHELEKILDLHIPENSTSKPALLDICRQVVQYSVKTGHPHFFNQLWAGVDSYGLAGAWLTDALNSSQYTYEVAPVFTLMEKTVLSKMLSLIGFPDGDAIFCPGGSVSNMYGINLARFNSFPEVKTKGMQGLPNLCVLTSDKGHYSMKKGAAMLGLGIDNIIPVETDEIGRMKPEQLESTILDVKAQGRVPIMVNATAGTTVLGAYDPLNAIADICQKHGIWMHVDAAWGGGVLLSKKYRHLIAGIERVDSVTWNPHKMMGSPLQAAAFLTRHKTLLAECHSAHAKYLFQQDKFYDVTYDTGDKSIQCGRKIDVLKVWMMWKAKGDEQYEKDINNIFHCAEYLTNRLRNTEGFRLVLDKPQCTNVGFWYIPPSMRGQTEDKAWWDKLSKVAPTIKQRMTEQGTMLIGYQPEGNRVNFFRMIVSNLDVTTAEMDFVVYEIDRLGNDL